MRFLIEDVTTEQILAATGRCAEDGARIRAHYDSVEWPGAIRLRAENAEGSGYDVGLATKMFGFTGSRYRVEMTTGFHNESVGLFLQHLAENAR